MKIKAIFRKIFIFIAGVLTLKGMAYSFDYLLYPFVILKLGLINGFIAMLFASYIMNFVAILLYDVTKKDMFGFETIKNLKNEAGKKEGFIGKLVQAGSFVTFIGLSFYDPFLATLWFRKSTKFDGLTSKDYKNLILSTLVGNLIWAPMVFGAVKLIF